MILGATDFLFLLFFLHRFCWGLSFLWGSSISTPWWVHLSKEDWRSTPQTSPQSDSRNAASKEGSRWTGRKRSCFCWFYFERTAYIAYILITSLSVLWVVWRSRGVRFFVLGPCLWGAPDRQRCRTSEPGVQFPTCNTACSLSVTVSVDLLISMETLLMLTTMNIIKNLMFF